MANPTIQISTRLTPEAAEALKYISDKWGISQAQALNKLILDAKASQ